MLLLKTLILLRLFVIKKVIVEVENLLKVGEINPNEIQTPDIFVDFIVKGEN